MTTRATAGTPRDRTRIVHHVTATLLVATVSVCLAACAMTKAPTTAAKAPAVLTVPQITAQLEQGTPPDTILSQIQSSGTVYRMDLEQTKALRASGMPASLIAQMQLIYEHAIQTNPALAQSNDKWSQIDGYWYGGLPFGWPREWVVGAPRLGEAFR